MSGSIFLPDGAHWSAAGWLFRAVLRCLSSSCNEDLVIVQEIESVLASGTGTLDLNIFSQEAADEVVRAIRVDLLRCMNAELPDVGLDHEGAMAVVRRLIDAAAPCS